MPTYDYECDACGHKFEEFQSIKAEPLKVCPVCKKKKVRRLIGAGACVIFKGSGFYCTDYRDGNYKTSASNDKPKTESTPATTTESKPATETKPVTSTTSTASTASTEIKTEKKKAS